MMTPQERYARDVDFHALVDTMQMFITKCQLTPTELREAAMLAAIHYEERHPKTFVYGQPEWDHLGLVHPAPSPSENFPP
jgi:hypothetical protein